MVASTKPRTVRPAGDLGTAKVFPVGPIARLPLRLRFASPPTSGATHSLGPGGRGVWAAGCQGAQVGSIFLEGVNKFGLF